MAARSRVSRMGILLGTLVAAGVFLGTYFKFWNGPGAGGTSGPGASQSGDTSTSTTAETVSHTTTSSTAAETPRTDPLVSVKVVIDERSYFLRTAEGETPTQVEDIVRLVKEAQGDADGIRLRIYRKGTSRVSAETRLTEALAAAGIPESAILLVPTTPE